MGDAHGGIGPVDILSARAAGAVGVDLQIFLIDLNRDVVAEFGKRIGGGERGMASRIAVERRDAHKPVNAAFRLEVAVGELSFHAKRHALDARLLARLQIDNFILEALALEPAPVHAHENARPVARLGSARAGVNEEKAVVAVETPGKETDQFDLVQMSGKRFPCAVRLGEKAFVLSREFGDGVEVLHLLDKILIGLDGVLAGTEFLDGLLRLLLVVPEVGACHDLFQLRHFLLVCLNLQEVVKPGESQVGFLRMRFDFFNNHNFFSLSGCSSRAKSFSCVILTL